MDKRISIGSEHFLLSPDKMMRFFGSILLCFFVTALVAGSAAQEPRGKKEFPPGLLRRVEDLPPSRLRDQIERLPVQARDRAVASLGNFHFTTEDLASLHADSGGGIFYADEFERAPGAGTDNTEFEVAFAAVQVSPFPQNLIFHSRPGAPNVLYLNFSGETVTGTVWNDSLGRSSIPAVAFSTDSDRTTFSDSEQAAIKRIWQRVAEDYAPFNIDVTTERPATFTTRTAHALVTRRTDANGAENPAAAAGGVAYVGVFANSNYARYRPAWIYHNNLAGEESYIAEALSHEIGHNMGLSHDGKSDGTDYYSGHGSGETSWGPLMGTGYNRNVSQWSKGEYFQSNNTQDDLATIAGKISYRTDDHGNSLGAATSLAVSSGGDVLSTTPETDPGNANAANKGILERNTDVDVFSFAAGSGPVSLNINPWVVSSGTTRGGNVDVLVELYNSAGQKILTNNIAGATGASIQTNLTDGVYYLMIKPTGVGNPTTSNPSGYTVYGSVGQYFISGTVIPSGAAIPPGAELQVSDITEPGITSHDFTVRYTDNVGINVASLGNDDIRVTGPNGFSAAATLVSIDLPSNGTPRLATYRINAPAGNWSENDGGVYAVSLQPDAVTDTEGVTVAPVTLGEFRVAVPHVIYSALMSTNPGWTMEGLWEYGAPNYGSGGPVGGATGPNILAYNLSGPYENRLAPKYVTTQPINCTGSATITLRFKRWLGVRNGDTAVVQVSTNGTSWTDVWSNQRVVLDTSWTPVQYTLPAWVAGSSSVQLRWGMGSGQSQNDIGWNIDDVVLLGDGTLDTEAPTAAINVANLTVGDSPSHSFTVTYTDSTAVSIASLGSADLLVLGPNGYSNYVEFAGVDTPTDGSPRTALYSIPAPTGFWQSTDNGTYQVILQDSEVTDTANNPAAEQLLGTFFVAIVPDPQALLVTPTSLSITEGTNAAFTVRLAERPSVEVTVVARTINGDPDFLIVSGATNVFTSDNWDIPLPVTVRALTDADRENGTGTIQCESDGLTSISVIVTEQDTTPLPPTVALTAPAAQASFFTTDTITFSADATDDAAVVKVEFFANGNLIGEDISAPYRITSELPAGSHSITARATDNANASATTPPITITVTVPANQPPSVTLTASASGVILAPGTVLLQVSATDPDGTISQIRFFNGTNSFATDTTQPYEQWVNLPAGQFLFTAVATDNNGSESTSAAIRLKVAEQPQIISITPGGTVASVTVRGTSGIPVILEATSDFLGWTPIATNTPAGGSTTFNDPSPQLRRLYRAVVR